jgi:hypothetical protein
VPHSRRLPGGEITKGACRRSTSSTVGPGGAAGIRKEPLSAPPATGSLQLALENDLRTLAFRDQRGAWLSAAQSSDIAVREFSANHSAPFPNRTHHLRTFEAEVRIYQAELELP